MARLAEDLMDRPALDLASFLPYRLAVVSTHVGRAFARRYASEFGLSIPEWRVLAVIGQQPFLSSNDVCDRTAMDKAKVSRAVSRLVAGGLLKYEKNPTDKRLIMLALSRRGRQVYDGIVPRALQLEAELAAALGPEERMQLDRILEKLNSRISQMDAVEGIADSHLTLVE